MSGNTTKYVRNKPGGSHVSHDVGDAVDIEDACHAINYINKRKRMERSAARRARPITLPSADSLRKLLNDD